MARTASTRGRNGNRSSNVKAKLDDEIVGDAKRKLLQKKKAAKAKIEPMTSATRGPTSLKDMLSSMASPPFDAAFSVVKPEQGTITIIYSRCVDMYSHVGA